MLLSTGMTTASPFLSKGRGAIISYPTAATGLHLWLSLPCTPGLCLEAGTSHAKGCLSLHPSSGYAHSLIWLLHLGGAVWVMGSAPSFCRRGDTGSTPLTTVHLLLCPRAPAPLRVALLACSHNKGVLSKYRISPNYGFMLLIRPPLHPLSLPHR